MGEHAKLSPSSADRWVACPGSVQLIDSLPDDMLDDEETEYSAEGTLAHALLEKSLREARNPHEFVGQDLVEFDNPGFAVAPGSEMADHIENVVKEIAQRYQAFDETPVLYAESKVTLNDDIWGTLDCALHWEKLGLLEVIDLKYGRGHMVEADCLQLAIYAAAFLRTRGLEAATIVTSVVQPRGYHDEGMYRSFTRPYAELAQLIEEIEIMGDVAMAANAYFNPSNDGEGQCLWCPAKRVCKERADMAVANARKAFDIVESDSVITDEETKFLLENVPGIIKMYESVKAQMLENCLNNGEIMGYKAIEGPARRRYKVDDAAAIEAFGDYGIPPDECSERKVLSFTKMEKICPEGVAELVEKPRGQPKLVKADHKSPAITSQDLFDDVVGQ